MVRPAAVWIEAEKASRSASGSAPNTTRWMGSNSRESSWRLFSSTRARTGMAGCPTAPAERASSAAHSTPWRWPGSGFPFPTAKSITGRPLVRYRALQRRRGSARAARAQTVSLPTGPGSAPSPDVPAPLHQVEVVEGRISRRSGRTAARSQSGPGASASSITWAARWGRFSALPPGAGCGRAPSPRWPGWGRRSQAQ